MKNLAEEVIEAHGGLARWQATETVSLRLWAGGIAFRNLGEHRRRSTAWRGRWSLDQVAEFTAGALWTYVNAPLLAFLDGVTVEAPHPQRQHETRALRLTLPPGLGVHGPNHTLRIDDHGLIQSHHYVATAFGQWALAAQSVDDTQSFDGLLIGTRRPVTPRLSPTRGTPGPGLNEGTQNTTQSSAHRAQKVRSTAACRTSESA